MTTYQIIGSIGIKSNRTVERADTCSYKHKRTTLKQCGYNDAQRKQILEIKREMNKFSTTC